jgi:hypothetical protein
MFDTQPSSAPRFHKRECNGDFEVLREVDGLGRPAVVMEDADSFAAQSLGMVTHKRSANPLRRDT